VEPDVNGYKYDDFERSAEFVRAGEIVTRAALPEIRKWLQSEASCSLQPGPLTAPPAPMSAD
jgi:hypothetical protein